MCCRAAPITEEEYIPVRVTPLVTVPKDPILHVNPPVQKMTKGPDGKGLQSALPLSWESVNSYVAESLRGQPLQENPQDKYHVPLIGRM